MVLVALVLVLLLLDILVFGPGFWSGSGSHLCPDFGSAFVYGSGLFRLTIFFVLFSLSGPGFSFGAHFDSDFCTSLLTLTFSSSSSGFVLLV